MIALPSIVEEDHATITTEGTVAHTEADGGHGPELLGLGAEGWVYVSITIFFLIAIFGFKAHRKIADGLDAKIAEARKSLDEADAFRKEAEVLLADAKSQQANSAKDAAAMMANAQREADALVEKAEVDSKAMVERRKRMAEDKISAAERDAIDEVRALAASAATQASRMLIAERHGESADRKLADEIIANI